jgi:hypothetical protein
MRKEFLQKPTGMGSNYPAIYSQAPFTKENRLGYVKDSKELKPKRTYFGSGASQEVKFEIEITDEKYPRFIVLKSTDARFKDEIIFSPIKE